MRQRDRATSSRSTGTRSRSFTSRLLDLDRSPGAAKRLGVSNYNVVVLEADGRRERVDLVNEESAHRPRSSRSAGRRRHRRLRRQGHGEHDPRDDDERRGAAEAAAALAARRLRRARRCRRGAHSRRTPAWSSWPAPQRDLRPPRSTRSTRTCARGGRLLVLADPDAPRSRRALLARFGIELGDDVVVDEQRRLFGTDGLSARVAYLNQELVREPPARERAPAASRRRSRSIDAPGRARRLSRGDRETTWADIDGERRGAARTFRPGGIARAAAGRRAGPRRGAGRREGRLVVVGDADFATNLHLGVLGNRDLLLAAAELAARGDEALTASRPRPATSRTVLDARADGARGAHRLLGRVRRCPRRCSRSAPSPSRCVGGARA